MDDQRDSRAADSTPQTSDDEPSTETATVAAVSRMLANPRRVRRA
jgi:hypothetical protein